MLFNLFVFLSGISNFLSPILALYIEYSVKDTIPEKRINPSKKTIFKSKAIKNNIRDTKSIIGSSFFKTLSSIFKGLIIADKPRTKPMFAIFEPMILPRAIDSAFLRADTKLMNNSGADVPKATIVEPMIIVLMPRDFASRDEFLTKYSAPR